MLPFVKINYRFSKIYPEVTYKMKFYGNIKNSPGFGGAVIYCNNVEIWRNKIFVGNNLNDIYPEYISLVFGLKQAVKFNIQNLFVIGKNNYIINHMNGICNNIPPEIKVLYNQVKDLENNFESIKYICISYF
jgi:ribonuclease HI